MRILLRSCQKVWRSWKADPYFESCSLWAPIFRGPCDQVALLNALQELEWLTPFDEGSRATGSARTWEGAGAYGTRIRMQLYLECYCAYRRHQGCHCINGDFGASPIFAQLSDKPLLASIWLCGVSSSLAPGSQQQLCRFPGSRLIRGRPDCVAEVVGLELRNVVAKYLFETSHRFAGMQPNSDLGDYS